MSRDKQAEQDRKEKVAALRAAQQRAERRRSLLFFCGIAALVLALIGGVTAVVVREQRDRARAEAELNKPIEGLVEAGNLSRDHTAGKVDYASTPPMGGDHNAVWADCGIYTRPVQDENAVHSLEHGAVWIAYRPDLATDQLRALTTVAQQNDYVLLSPYPALTAPIVVTAWGKQITMTEADDPRLARFLHAYLQGPQTPEPGAACTGGSPVS